MRKRNEKSTFNKELGLDAKDQTQWKSALDKIKSHLTNQIEDLQIQIDNKERRKVDRTETKLDDIAKDLKAQRCFKEELDNLVGKPELSIEENRNG
jgi:hypothetical protein